MPRLKDRQRQIPNGLRFALEPIGFVARPYTSFDTLVNQVWAVIQANPGKAAMYNWPRTYEDVQTWVDAENATICVANGWLDYVIDASTAYVPPKPRAPQQIQQSQKEASAAAGRVSKIWSGVRTLNSWIDSGEPAVPDSLSSSRAAVCAACPKNGTGDFTKWFTQPAADVIKRQMERVSDRKLVTPSDAKLGVCEVCLCPLKLKVHAPVKFIKEQLSPLVLKDLAQVPGCWVTKEAGEG